MKRFNLLLLALVVLLSLFSGVLLVSGQSNQAIWQGTRWEYLVFIHGKAYSYDPDTEQFTDYTSPDNVVKKAFDAGMAHLEPDTADTMMQALALNVLGAEGWEAIYVNETTFSVMMKRPRQ